jgi:hypothetical protein
MSEFGGKADQDRPPAVVAYSDYSGEMIALCFGLRSGDHLLRGRQGEPLVFLELRQCLLSRKNERCETRASLTNLPMTEHSSQVESCGNRDAPPAARFHGRQILVCPGTSVGPSLSVHETQSLMSCSATAGRSGATACICGNPCRGRGAWPGRFKRAAE